jgi:hypothetical protein
MHVGVRREMGGNVQLWHGLQYPTCRGLVYGGSGVGASVNYFSEARGDQGKDRGSITCWWKVLICGVGLSAVCSESVGLDVLDGVEGEFDVGDRYLKIELGVIRCHIRYTCEWGQLTSSWLYLA